MISHTILCHMSVHRRDCTEFLLTAFLLCCSAGRSCLSHASEIFRRQFFHNFFFTDFTTTEANCFMDIHCGIFVPSSLGGARSIIVPVLQMRNRSAMWLKSKVSFILGCLLQDPSDHAFQLASPTYFCYSSEHRVLLHIRYRDQIRL